MIRLLPLLLLLFLQGATLPKARIETASMTSKSPDESSSRLKLWYKQPAREWVEALPVGNGHLGAMVFGGVEKERIQLNENSLWDGHRQDTNNPEALKHLPEVRKLLFEGRNREATEIAGKYLMGNPSGVKSYQSLGDLWIDSDPGGKVEEYRRELDLENGIVRTTYKAGDARYTREVFASFPDEVIVIRMTCDRPGRINSSHRLTRQQDANVEAYPNGDRNNQLLIMHGQIKDTMTGATVKSGMKFETRVEVVQSSGAGSVQAANGSIKVSNADALTIVVTAKTNYRFNDYDRVCATAMSVARQRGFTELKDRHIQDYRRLFSRVSIDLGHNEELERLPTNERLDAVKKGLEDPGLAALYFQYGRYLLMSSSRPGGLPANLQGLWNEHMNAPWNSDFHTNINLQMNYWPAEVTNLAECHEPLLNYVEGLVEPGKKTARTRGIL